MIPLVQRYAGQGQLPPVELTASHAENELVVIVVVVAAVAGAIQVV